MAAGGVGTGIEPPVYRSSVRQAGPEAVSRGPVPPATCENCGAPSARPDLASVRRVYLEVGGTARSSRARAEAGVEWWCTACRTLYPSEPAGAPDGPAGP